MIKGFGVMRSVRVLGSLLLRGSLVIGCASDGSKLTRGQRMVLEPARDAEARGDDVAALRHYKSAAEDGLLHAQYMVARFYLDGRGTAADPEAAAYWYQRASDGGYALA